MKPTRMHLVGAAVALSTMAIAAPVSTAGAATAPPAVAPVAILTGGWDGSPVVTLPTTAPVAGQAATIIGPAIITTAPTTFINTNNQVTAGSAWSGGQLAR